MTSERGCYVYIVQPGGTEFVTAGRFVLSQNRDGISVGTFFYGKKYLSRSDAVELDPIELRLSTQKYNTARLNGFFGVIRDAMPDYWGRCVIERNVGQQRLMEFDYLLEGPDDRAGALGFGLGVEPPAPSRVFNKTIQLDVLQELAYSIMNNTSNNDPIAARQVQELLLAGTSMGGARPKAVVEDKGSLWIAKFSSPHDRWNQPIVEHAFLNLAKLCGLQVAESKLCVVSDKDVLLVRRFDREKTECGYRRHRMVSALTLLKSEESPVARDLWSYLLLADEIRRCTDTPKSCLHELFSRMCFNAIVSNLDDHPRNHALIATNHHWRLSPAYDLTPTSIIAQDARFLAMSCGQYGRLASYENLLTSHGRFLLTKKEATTILDGLIHTVKQQWDSCLRRAGASEKDCMAIASSCLYDGFYYRSGAS